MRRLTILQLNDLHGYLAPHPELFELTGPAIPRSGGGLPRIAAMFRAIRRDADDAVMAFDNGDTFHGTLPAVQTGGDALVAPMAALGLDAMTVHWEFVYGLDRLRRLANQLAYPILAANLRDPSGALSLPPYTIIERAGVRVGVIGLAAVIAGHLLPRAERDRVELTIGDAELQSIVPTLRRDRGVDLVVVLSHLGFPQDCKLAAAVPRIDIILSGHTHNRLAAPAVVNDTVIMQSGAHGSFVGRLDVGVAGEGLAEWRHTLLPVDETVDPDPGMQSLVDASLAPFVPATAKVVGETGTLLHRYAMFESTMDNLLLDATAEAAGTAVALSNGWRYGTPIAPGPLTESDLWSIVPANPPVSVVQLTGRELRDLFEANLESTFACDPWRQRGGYMKRCRGIEMVLKLENPAGHRIQELRLDGAAVDEDMKIPVGFLGEQAVPRDRGSDRRSTGITAIAALDRHLRLHRTVQPALRGHIRVA